MNFKGVLDQYWLVVAALVFAAIAVVIIAFTLACNVVAASVFMGTSVLADRYDLFPLSSGDAGLAILGLGVLCVLMTALAALVPPFLADQGSRSRRAGMALETT